MKKSGYCLFIVFLIMISQTFCFGQATKAIAVAGGESHGVALKDDGTVWAWGVNARGQLGNGTVENSLTPVQVVDTSDPIGYLTHVTAIAVGTLYSLGSGGHSLALKESGTVFAWGLNAAGQLGDGTQEIRTTAVQVIDSTDATGYLTGITAISAGAQHSLAVKQDGTLWAWGDNYYGQLGDATRTTRWYPGQVSGFVGGTAVAGGYGHSLALKQDGSVWAWGNNGYGQLGSGDGVYRQLPVQVVDFSNGIAVAAGKYHSAVLRNDGTVWTWGANPSGELGNGTWGWSTSQNRPVQVIDPSDPSGYLTHVIAIACGDEHAMALKEDGTVFAWGANNFGQLGDGTTGNKNTPVMVSALNGVTAIKGGRGHSLAVKGDGTAWAWGGNWAGQLGDGTTEPKTAPVLVSFPLQPERKLLSVRAAYFIVPGEEITDVIQYDNNVGITLEDAIAVYQLPGYFTYVSATKGGMFHEEEKQVYWMLGNLSPNEKGYLSVKVRVPWGIPNHTKLSMYADIAARNIPSNVNVDDYLAYTPFEVVSETNLTGGQISQLLSSAPELKNNYDHALSLGYVFDQVTQEVSFSDGSSVVIFAMIDPEEYGPVFLKKVGDSVFMEKYGESSSTYSLFKKDGGYRINLYDGSSTPWGTWAEAHDESLAPLGTRAEGISQAVNNCVSVCIAQTVPEWNDYIKDKFKGSIRKTCLLCQASLNRGKRDPDACSYCAREYLAVHREKRDLQYGEKIAPCVEDCERQSGKWQCVKDQIHSFCSSLDPILDILDIGFTGHVNVGAEVYNCVVDTTGSRWVKDTGKSRKCYEEIGEFCTVTPPPAHCYKCPPASLNQYGAMRAVGFYCPRYATPTRRETESGGDPNAKSVDVSGQVIPGQKLTYTIEYENVGEGAAYGVFITDELDPNLDETSLAINNGGSFSSAARLLSWDIGELPSKGKGSVNFSVNVKNGLSSGTEITNYADVYFPSVPEITPTNAVVNIVKTIAADPLTIEALSEEPTSITLTGRDSGSKALTYKVTVDPSYGTLEGKPPKLTYTTMEEFSGQDEFYYVVNNGIIDSDPARVVIKVSPNPFDTRPPRVRDTYPKADAASVHVSDNPRSTDPLMYIPTITATFSEPIDMETITTSTFTVAGLTGTVGYNEVTRTAIFIPSTPLSFLTTYTVQVGPGIKDKVGNSMTESYSWQFTTESAENISVTLPDNALEVNFGIVRPSQVSKEKVVNISSTGTEDLLINTITLNEDNSGDFTILDDRCSGVTLAQSENCTVKLEFSPSSKGTKQATLSIPSNDPDTPTYEVSLWGVGTTSKISLVTPNGGEVMASGSTETIRWGIGPGVSKVTLSYSMDNGKTWSVIGKKLTGTRHDWTVPSPTGNKKKCLIQVTGYSSKNKKVASDTSDAPFTIEVVKLTSPNGPEPLTSESTQEISWEVNGTAKPVAAIDLFNTGDGGKGWSLIKSLPGTERSHEWTVPDLNKPKCKVKVLLKDEKGKPLGNDLSDNWFAIEP